MKIHFLKTITAILIASVYFSSCDKTKKESKYSDAMADFFESTSVKFETIIFDASSEQYIQGSKGTRFYFPLGCFKIGGTTIISGNIELRIKEIYSKGDIILSNMSTACGNNLLQSSGEVYATASQGQYGLKIDSLNPPLIGYKTIGTIRNDMQLFRDSPNTYWGPCDCGIRKDYMNWFLADDDTASVVADSSTNQNYYYFPFTDWGWDNCDRFVEIANGTDPTIKLPSGFDEVNTYVFMVFDDENVVVPADIFENNSCRFHSGENTPAGLPITIVALGTKGNDYYYSITHEVTEADKTFELNMNKASKETIQAAISVL